MRNVVLPLLPGAAAAGFLLLLAGGAIGALLAFGGGVGPTAIFHDAYVLRVAGFTLLQAGLSTLLSIAFALPVARALHRRRFLGRSLLIRLFGLCLVTPAILAVLGLVQVHGRSGWLDVILSPLGLEGGRYLYGLSGILLAHVFFNMPLTARGLLHALEGIPPEHWRLAAQMRMSGWALFWLVEWPALRAALPGLAGLILILCFTSFAIILTLGGGPNATTLEVAIYQALRFDFDPGRAVMLSLLQIILCGGVAGLLLRCGRPAVTEITSGQEQLRPDGGNTAARLWDGLVLGLAAFLVLPPLMAVVTGGVNSTLMETLADPALHRAMVTSVAVAIPAGLLAFSLGFAILWSSRALALRREQKRGEQLEALGLLILVVPPFVLATGLFLILRDVTDVFALGPVLVSVVNACMALPYVIRLVGPAWHRTGRERDHLCHSLGMVGWARLRLGDWPVIRRPVALALAFATALSLGDFGIAALFGSQNFTTLPLYIHRAMGAYRMEQAAVAGLVLILLCLVIFLLIERGLGRKDA